MKPQVKTVVTQAIVSSLLVGGAAFAQEKHEGAAPAGEEMHGDKNGCNKDAVKHQDGKEEAKGHKKKDKDSCKGKNGCNKEGATK